jgi:hypothetical protein
MRAARGKWIKLLHDDDVLHPDCLRLMLLAVQSHPRAMSVSCRADHYYNGKKVYAFDRGSLPFLEAVAPEHVHLAMYLLEDVGGAPPSLQMISRDVVREGVLFEEVDGMRTLVDSCWNARVRSLGASLILNAALIDWNQGTHKTETSGQDPEILDQEFVRFRRFVVPFIPPSVCRPPLSAVEDMVRLVRALYRLRRGEVRLAIKLLTRVRNLQAVMLASRWLVNQRSGARGLTSIQRHVIVQEAHQLATHETHCA